MRTRKTLTLLIIIGLFVLPFLEIAKIQPALAEEFTPPTLHSGGGDTPPETDGELLMEPSYLVENSHDTIETQVLTGQTPEGVIPPNSVEVLIPASQPVDRENTNSGAQSRPEGSYFVNKGITATTGPDILLLYADADSNGDSPIQAILQAYGDIGVVDLFDAGSTIPSLSLLKEYDVVLTWANFAFADKDIVGDILADYVDMGGKVINLTWALGDYAGNDLGGRFITQNYTAMRATTFSMSTDCLGSYNTSSPIMFGITHACDYYRYTGTYLTQDSSAVAEYRDGELLVAAKDDRSVVSINAYIGYDFNWSGLIPDVVHNAIWWLHDTTSRGSYGVDYGPLVTHPYGGYDGANVSVLQTSLGMNTYGFGNQFSLGYRIADDFEVTDPVGWLVDHFTFFEYQNNSDLTPTITSVYFQIWDGPPDNPASSVVFGDLTTNRLVDTYWSNIYRIPDYSLPIQKPVMTIVAEGEVYLPQGTYWLDWMADGTLPDGPWAPPITINGSVSTGNALQYTSTWGPVVDAGTGSPQGFPFLVQGYVPDSLWNQSLSLTNQIALVDQEAPDDPPSSAYLADDFYVHSLWKLESIFVPGDLWGGGTSLDDATALTFMVFEDDGGKPAGDPEGGGAPPIWVESLSPFDFQILIYPGSSGKLSNVEHYLYDPVTLPLGRYWLIFYPTMDSSLYGRYGRQSADTTYGNAGHFINPGGGWGFGSVWQDWRIVPDITLPDIAFRLGGIEIFLYLPLITK